MLVPCGWMDVWMHACMQGGSTTYAVCTRSFIRIPLALNCGLVFFFFFLLVLFLIIFKNALYIWSKIWCCELFVFVWSYALLFFPPRPKRPKHAVPAVSISFDTR